MTTTRYHFGDTVDIVQPGNLGEQAEVIDRGIIVKVSPARKGIPTNYEVRRENKQDMLAVNGMLRLIKRHLK